MFWLTKQVVGLAIVLLVVVGVIAILSYVIEFLRFTFTRHKVPYTYDPRQDHPLPLDQRPRPGESFPDWYARLHQSKPWAIWPKKRH